VLLFIESCDILKGLQNVGFVFQALMKSMNFLHIQMQIVLWILMIENPEMGVLFYLTMDPLHSRVTSRLAYPTTQQNLSTLLLVTIKEVF
jgi:hypothetical protein